MIATNEIYNIPVITLLLRSLLLWYMSDLLQMDSEQH